MSKVIDQRVVEMKFDNQQFETNIKTSMSTLERFKQALSFDGVKKGFTEIESASKGMKLDGLGDAVETVKSRFSALEVAAVTALANITNSAVNAGKQLLHSLTIAPIAQGFDEYELKMNSVQTIMASTGEDIKTVNKYLDELNLYADKTIYSFSDMTQNIGKFTNAGVKLEDAVKAIQGISNEAAVSGANANEASRAMYNFAQALSAGYVKLIDWKSIENANMATVEFKQTLIDTALAMGTVVKEGDKYKSTTTNLQGKVSDLFDATSMFNDSLAHQWMSTDVLVQALNIYSTDVRQMTEAEKKAYEEKLRGLGFTEQQIKQYEELGKKAFDSAQDVKTFHQLLDTLREAVGSGWARTFEIIFGDLEEAKVLWTAVSKVVGGFIDRVSDARNNMLQLWADAKVGGRADLLEGLKNVFNAFASIARQISAAFNDIFKPITSTKLIELTKQFKAFTEGLKLNAVDAGNLRATFRGLFSIIDLGIQGIKTLITVLSPLTAVFKYLASGILNVTGWIGEMIYEFDKFVQVANPFTNGTIRMNEVLSSFVATAQKSRAFAALTTIFEKLGVAAGQIGDRFRGLYNKLRESEDFGKLVKVFENLGQAIGWLGMKGMEYLNQGLEKLAAMDFTIPSLETIYNYIEYCKDKVKGFLQSFKDIGPFETFAAIFDRLGTKFSDFVKKFQDDGSTFSKIINKISEAFGSSFLTSNKMIENAANNFKAVSGAIKTALDSLTVEKILAGGGIAGLIFLAVKLHQLSQSFKKDKAVLINSIAGAFDSLSGVFDQAKKNLQAQTMLDIAKAIGILVLALIGLAMVPAEDLKKGGAALAGVMAGFAAVMFTMSRLTSSVEGLGTGQLLALGVAMLAIVHAMKQLSDIILKMRYIKWDYLKGGIAAIFNGLMSVAAALVTVSRMTDGTDAAKMVAIGAAFMEVAYATQLLSMSILALSQLDLPNLAKGVVAVAVGIMAMTSALSGVSLFSRGDGAGKMMAVGAAFIEIAFATQLLSMSVLSLSQLDLPSLAKGVAGVVAGLMAMTGALGGMALLMKVTGNGGGQLIAAASSFVILATAMNMLILPIKILGAMDLPSLAKGVGAIVASMAVMAGALTLVGKFAGPMALAAGAGFIMLAAALNLLVPPIVALGLLPWEVVKQGLMALGLGLAGITAAAIVGGPAIALLGAGFLMLGTSVMAAGVGVNLLATGLALLVPAILGLSAISEGTMTRFIGAIDTILQYILQLIPTIAQYVAEGLLALISKVAEMAPDFADAFTTIATAILAVIAALGPALLQTLGILYQALLQFIKDNTQPTIDTLLTVWKDILTAIRDNIGDFVTLGADIVINFMNGISSKAGELVTAGINMAISLIDALATGIDNNADKFITAFERLIASVLSLLGQAALKFIPKGADLILKLGSGIFKAKAEILKKIVELAAQLLEKIGVKSEWVKKGKDFIQGLIEGFVELRDKAVNKIKEIGSSILNGIRGIFDEHSPSKEAHKIGAFFMRGMDNGFIEYGKRVQGSAVRISEDILDTFKTVMSAVSDYISSDYEPTITPVMDLSNVTAGAGDINKLFENTKTQELAWQASSNGNFNVMTDLTKQLNSKFDSFNNDDVVSELAGLRSDIAAMNERLGRMQVVMDTGTLVGALGPGMDNYLGNMSVLAGRGV